jgi:peptidyl-tRNA hydrolase, PTH1 family
VSAFTGTYLIVGLGNPGPEYIGTRHNVGADVVRSLAGRLGLTMSSRKFKAESARTVLHGRPTIFLCPDTYMNLSGISVKACVDYYKVSPETTLVVHDDLDLPLERLKAVTGGGAGGHKWLASIIEHLGSANFPRLKIGIGRSRFDEPVDRYVLSRFYPDEKEVVLRVLQAADTACEQFVLDGIDRLMNRINRHQIHKTEVKH